MGQPLIASRTALPLFALAASFLYTASAPAAEPEPDAATPAASSARTPPPPPPPSEAAAGTQFQERYVLDTGRIPPTPAKPGEIRPSFHGEYQLRVAGMSDLPIQPYTARPDTATLGQTTRVEHWLRLTPRVMFGPKLAITAQADVDGFMAGQTTQLVDDARDSYAERKPFKFAPRWLYVDWLTPIGLLRVGQQPSHWGMGILANDGDHPSLFGDYRNGSIAERVLFGVRPGGEDSPINVVVAGDVVFQDATARLVDSDLATQGVLAAFYENKSGDRLGFYGVYRHQRRDGANAVAQSFDETLSVWGIDSAGRVSAKIPGSDGHIFGEYEVAWLFGDTNFVRTVTETSRNEREDISQVGAAARIGAVLEKGAGAERYGMVVPSLEWGWASGDANPNDGVTKRFRFDPNHRVGLLMFDAAMAWRTARAASIARDPGLIQRPAPGSDLLPSNGAIFGATYLYPTVVMRPMRELDLKLGAVIAQTTADFVDPVKLGTTGRFQNFDGGDATSRNLGIELDAGVEYRYALCACANLQLGAQGGLLFPGKAFANAAGETMGAQKIVVGRVGLQF